MKEYLIKVSTYLAMLIYKFKMKFNKLIGKAILLNIKNRGINCSIEGEGILIDEKNLILGSHIFIGRNFFIRATGGIEIGDYSHISRNVVLHTVNHNINGDCLPYDRNDIRKKIYIGKFVWIGMNVNILPGVRIGDGAVIGMGTTISKDVKPGEIVVGSAQRVVGCRDDEYTQELIKNNLFLKK